MVGSVARSAILASMGRLDDYRRKRDFRRTPEPPPHEPAERAGGVFVVHRHEARNLHYDLRIEIDGVLCSWAVPKGFSYDPKEKRLAVRTEDHPLEYEDFSGTIPKGEYGAGTMTIWDKGSYACVVEPDPREAVEKGEVKLVLRGRRLRGEWHLVKTKGGPNHWLLFKSKDRYAGPSRDNVLGVDLSAAKRRSLPRGVRVMRATAAAEIADDPRWLFEMEFVGRRAIAEKVGDEVRLRGLRRAPEKVEEGLRSLRAENALLDGVLVALDDDGRPSAGAVERSLSSESGALFYYAFDLLYFDEFDLRPLPLLDRKAALRSTIVPGPAVMFVDHVIGGGSSLAAAVAQAGLPGIIAKRTDAAYRPGASDAWRSIPVAAAPAVTPAGRASPVRPARRRRFRFTNLAKVYWPVEGYTKGDLVEWYEQVAELLLPYLHERPIHMLRYPDGIEGKSFYQRQANEQLPAWIPRVRVESGHRDEAIDQMIVNDRDALLYLVNLGSIDLHPWLSRRGSLDEPDFAVLDLDAKESPFVDVVRIAREAGRLLRGIGIRPLLKTSGASGMHVYVPLAEGYTYDHSKMFCELVARILARELKEIATVERVPGRRGTKVYLDFLQNRRSQTIVPPYVPRPVRGACVSTPLHWDELDTSLHPSLFTIKTVLPRVERHGDLFRPTLTDRQHLLPAIEKLGEQWTRG